MKNRGLKKRACYLEVLFIILILSSLVSAGWISFIKKTITGEASSAPFNVSLIISGTNPAEISYISPIAATNPTENSSAAVSFSLLMHDPDGVADLNDSSVNASFSMTGEDLRTTGNEGTCTLVADINGTDANYSCTINMWYWDLNGTWTITVQGEDIGAGTTVYNSTETWDYNLLRSFDLHPVTLSWSSLNPAAINQTASEAFYIDNMGNYNDSIQTNATDVIGETDSGQTIDAANFTVSVLTGDQIECIGDVLQNDTNFTITSSTANRGNLSVGGEVGQEVLYYCIPLVPPVSSQSYSTTNSRQWWMYYPV